MVLAAQVGQLAQGSPKSVHRIGVPVQIEDDRILVDSGQIAHIYRPNLGLHHIVFGNRLGGKLKQVNLVRIDRRTNRSERWGGNGRPLGRRAKVLRPHRKTTRRRGSVPQQ